MNSFARVVACCALLACSVAVAAAEDVRRRPIRPAPELPETLPWDLAALSEPPAVERLDDTAPVRSLLYAGEPFRGRATRVFAYFATPASIGGAPAGASAASAGPWPGIVLVHGGGGTAFAEWVKLWAGRGYAAIVMDLAGSWPDPEATAGKQTATRLPDGGTGQDHPAKFDTIATPDVTDDWPYHAVAQGIHRDREVADIGPAGPSHLGQFADQVPLNGRHRLGHIVHFALDARRLVGLRPHRLG